MNFPGGWGGEGRACHILSMVLKVRSLAGVPVKTCLNTPELRELKLISPSVSFCQGENNGPKKRRHSLKFLSRRGSSPRCEISHSSLPRGLPERHPLPRVTMGYDTSKWHSIEMQNLWFHSMGSSLAMSLAAFFSICYPPPSDHPRQGMPAAACAPKLDMGCSYVCLSL